MIDAMRFVGLSLIVLAHVSPPDVLFHLRSYDVPMMLFVSGLAYSGRATSYSWQFLKKRFLRLVVPVYVFLTFYFALTLGLCGAIGIDFGIRSEHVWGSYLLMEGFGYVWVIRVFLLVALLTPVLQWIENEVRQSWLYVMLVLVVAAAASCCVANGLLTGNLFLREFVYMTIGYSVMFMLGLRFSSFSPLVKCAVAVLFLSVAIAYAAAKGMLPNGWCCFNNYKWPPRLYFICYGVFMSMLTYAIVTHVRSFFTNRLFLFIGSNTIWIYLWHIPFVQLTGRIGVPWFLRYLIVYVCAITLYYAQSRLVEAISVYHKWTWVKYLKG